MNTFLKTEIERIAAQIATILLERAKGDDPARPETWRKAGITLCDMSSFYDCRLTTGVCEVEQFCEDAAPFVMVFMCEDKRKPKRTARNYIHELAHAIMFHYTPEYWTENPFAQYDYTYQAGENIARAVERIILGDYGRGWLPEHGLYWH